MNRPPYPFLTLLIVLGLASVLGGAGLALSAATPAERPDAVFLNGRIVTGESAGSVQQALAVRNGFITAVGTSAQIKALAGDATRVVDLEGRMVLPGLYESHVHALRCAAAEANVPYRELRSIPEIQAWIRRRAQEIPAGEWIHVPRNEITRLRERRHPTVAELDAACSTHPVVFTSARKHVFNRRGFAALGITDATTSVPNGEIILGEDGRPHMLATSSPQLTRLFAVENRATQEQRDASLVALHRAYHAAGITTIFERGSAVGEYRTYEKLRAEGRLNIRTRFTIRSSFRSGEDVRRFVEREKIAPGQGDDLLSIGPLKITVDGGIHWGNTRLSEEYGERRTRFYVHSDPTYRGQFSYAEDALESVFAEAARLGWQMVVHVTGDEGTDIVLRAMEAAGRNAPVKARRFILTHAYFPTPDLARRAAALGVGVDTQTYLYQMDAPFIHDIYGPSWAERFIGLRGWLEAGVPVAINADHMEGFDPNHSMNSYNPFLAMYIAVSRRAEDGRVYGPRQRLSRLEALRAMTAIPAYLNFEEAKSGTLEAGKFADFIVIDRDYLNCPEEEIRRIQVLRTVLGGKTVYERAD